MNEFVQTISKRFNEKFLQEKLSTLDKEPVVFKNLPNFLLKTSGEILANFSEKSFDILICDDFPEDFNLNEGKNISLSVGKVFHSEDLETLGLERVKRVWSKGEYSVLGDVVFLWPFNATSPLRVSLLGSKIENIDIVQAESFKKIGFLKSFEILQYGDFDVMSFGQKGGRYKFPFVFVNNENLQLNYGYEKLDFGFRNIPTLDYYLKNKNVLLKIIDDYISKNYEIFCSSKELKRVNNLLGMRKFVLLPPFFEKGFVNSNLKILVLSDYELFGKVDLGKGDWLKQILPGDFVVHEDHGIGLFERIVKNEKDTYIEIRYANKDLLLVPLSQNQKVTKYVGGRGRVPTLTTLSSGSWRRVKKKAKLDTQLLAKELLQIYAMREVLSFQKPNEESNLKKSLEKFVQDFEFKDTHDQMLVTQEIFGDVVCGKLMDRLLVGDVGFGKTEIAMRTAFLLLQMGMQVAVLAPTTILVEQHSAVFKKRFEKYGFNVSTLSRFLSLSEKEKVVKELAEGKVNVVIGTHGLLYDRVRFKNLGLIIIDEEQKFGVRQKEKIKEKRLQAHVLSMSATPIPRSLGMSLSGIRDISTLFTPPEGRKAIKNVVGSFEWAVVKKAVEFEIKRKGQVYFLHNKVMDIVFVKKKLQNLFPLLNISILHGSMSAREIAKVMNSFCSGQIDILICTTIIENGLDLPNVNTLIVDDSSRFGLSQLYQIRGRIGRSNVQAYAYFFYKTMKGNTELRLDAIMEAQDLGSGFLLANRDLEIRGVGDLLGKEQSGDINAIGYGLFMKYLSEAVESLRNKE